MILGGLRPCSFIDDPGRLAAVAFTRGCDLRCPYCHNPGLVAPPWAGAVAADDVLALLAARRGKLDGLVVTGGEPTLQPDLVPFLLRAKALRVRVKLDTSGTHPEVLEEVLARGLVDHVAMDLKDEPEAYPEWLGPRADPRALRRSLALLSRARVEHELRTTVVLPRHDPARLARMARVAAPARRWVLQAYRPGPALGPTGALRAPDREELEALAAWLRREHGARCSVRGAGARGAPADPAPPEVVSAPRPG